MERVNLFVFGFVVFFVTLIVSIFISNGCSNAGIRYYESAHQMVNEMPSLRPAFVSFLDDNKISNYEYAKLKRMYIDARRHEIIRMYD